MLSKCEKERLNNTFIYNFAIPTQDFHPFSYTKHNSLVKVHSIRHSQGILYERDVFVSNIRSVGFFISAANIQ